MCEHIKMPWVAVETAAYGVEVRCNGEDVAWVLSGSMKDARLIAAAPELLEVVHVLITCADQDFIANTSHQDSLGVLADAARAAIAKATEVGHG